MIIIWWKYDIISRFYSNFYSNSNKIYLFNLWILLDLMNLFFKQTDSN